MEFVAIAAVGMVFGAAFDALKRKRACVERAPVAIAWARDGRGLPAASSPSLQRP